MLLFEYTPMRASQEPSKLLNSPKFRGSADRSAVILECDRVRALREAARGVVYLREVMVAIREREGKGE